MSETFEESLSRVRAKRQHIARSINEIVALSDADSSILKNMTWDVLLGCPRWCVLEENSIQALRIACGALLGKHYIKTSLDGTVWKSFRDVIGPKMLEKIFAQDINDEPATQLPTLTISAESSMFDNVNAWGTAVLLASLNDSALLKMYTRLWSEPMFELDQSTALKIYQQGLSLLHDIGPSDLPGNQYP